MGEMKFDVSEIKGGAGGRYRPLLKCRKAVSPEEFAAVFSAEIGKPKPFAAFVLGTLKETITDLLQSGHPVNLGWVSLTPRLKGALRAKDASGDPERLEVVATPSRELRHCLREMKVINVNQIHGTMLYELQEDGQKQQNALHQPGARIVCNGENISIDSSRADEGVWLESQDGEVIAHAQVIYSHHSVCFSKFPELPKKKGTYVFVLSCRNGRGTDYGPKRLTRRVSVR